MFGNVLTRLFLLTHLMQFTTECTENTEKNPLKIAVNSVFSVVNEFCLRNLSY